MFENWRHGAQTLSAYFSSEKMRLQWKSNAPFLIFALKSALAVAFSWEIATLLLGKEAASLAPVSAVIIVQVTSWQTVRKSIERILGIIVGIILAILVIHLLGISFWTVLLLIFSSQIVGMFVQKRGPYLATQIPISAVLVLIASTSQIDYPLLRLLGALIGGVVGTLISLLLSPPVYIGRVRESIADLTSQIATAMITLSDAVAGSNDENGNRAIYERMLALEQQVQVAQQTLSLGFDSLRLNPWARSARSLLADYPDMLTAINRVVRQLRRISYTINDSLVPWHSIVDGQEWAQFDAHLLRSASDTLAWIAHYLSTSSTTLNIQENDTTNMQKEQIRATLDDAYEQLIAHEDALLHHTGKTRELVAAQGENPPPGKGYRLSLRGTLLTDLRRILQELNEVLDLLPSP
jgi:uncharacterized membrane protein YgaE (UPF0421/DUF939 family)